MSKVNYDDALAIVGVNFRFSQAKDYEELWNILYNTKDVRTKYTREELIKNGESLELLENKNYVPYSMELEDIDCFDANFFKYNERFAKILDPQNRLLLESSWHALEDAGYNPAKVGQNCSVGVFAGKNEPKYFFDYIVKDYINKDYFNDNENRKHFSKSLELITSYASDFSANWISYKLGLDGPALNIQTGCSTSFSVLSVAYQSLLTYQCDMALVGTASINISHQRGYLYSENSILSPDGICRPFDINSNGTLSGSGVASIVLKRYEDALRDNDHIEALILGVGITNDGNMKQDFMAPGLEGHAKAIKIAIERSGLDPSDIDFFESHGTATKLGDSVEISAIKNIFANDKNRKKPLVIGSVKSNLGHLYCSAGLASLIKVILCMKKETIVPTANFTEVNPYINLDLNDFYINSKPIDWKKGATPRRAGISSLGFGGTNIHIVVEEAPVINEDNNNNLHKEIENIVFFSALSVEQVNKMKKSWLPHIYSTKMPEDIAYTSLVGREHFQVRAAALIDFNKDNNRFELSSIVPKLSVDNPNSVWVFTGQGASVSTDFGEDLYENFRAYRQAIDKCKNIIGTNFFEQIFPKEKIENKELLEKPSLFQPRVFIIQYALAQLWLSLGIKPKSIIGHSLGEIAAACIAGVLSLEEGLKLVIARGKAFEEIPSGLGSMLVLLSKKELIPKLPSDLIISVINAEDVLVVSGLKKSIDTYQKICEKQNITAFPLAVTHAFHHPSMQKVSLSLRESIKNLTAKNPSIPIYSTLTGKNINSIMDINYWCEQIISPTLFLDALRNVIQEQNITIALEIGPKSLLSSLIKKENLDCVSCGKNAISTRKDILVSLGKLYEHGFVPNAGGLFEKGVKRISLPGYPFEKKSFWMEETMSNDLNQEAKLTEVSKDNITKDADNIMNKLDDDEINNLSFSDEEKELYILLKHYWQAYLGKKDIKYNDDFFSLGGTSLVVIQIIERINNDLGINLKIENFINDRTLEKLTKKISEEFFS